MFSGLFVNTWIVASIVAVVAGVVGFFTVLRGASFVAHAVPQCGFAGAALASLIGVNTVAGLGVAALLSVAGIGWMGRRSRNDVATALALVLMLGLGALFLSWSVEYGPEVYSLLFGEVLGVSSLEITPTALFVLVSVAVVMVVYRPLLLSSVVPDMAEAQGVSGFAMELCFLLIVALVTTMSVPVVGALLMFSLMVGPPAAARSVTGRPMIAMGLSVGIALAVVWASISISYVTQWPIGFFVGVLGAAVYLAGRAWEWWRRARSARSAGLPEAGDDRPASGPGRVTRPTPGAGQVSVPGSALPGPQ